MIEYLGTADAPSLLAIAILAAAGGIYPVGLMLGAPCSPCCGFTRCLRFEAVSAPDANQRTPEGTNQYDDFVPVAGFSKTVGSLDEVGVNTGPDNQPVIDEFFVPFPGWATKNLSGILFVETDPDKVRQFLAGEISLTGTVDTTQEEWTVRVEEPTDFCGTHIPNVIDFLVGMGVVDDAISWTPGPTCGCDLVPPSGATASVDGIGDDLQVEFGQVGNGRFGVVGIKDAQGNPIDVGNTPHDTPVNIAIPNANVARQPTARVAWIRVPPEITASVGGGTNASLSVSVEKRHTAPQTWRVSGVSVANGGAGYEWGSPVAFSTQDTVEEAAVAFARTNIQQPNLALAVASTSGTGAALEIEWTPTQVTWPPNTQAGKHPLSDTFYVPWAVNITNGGTGYAENDVVSITAASLSPPAGVVRLLKWWGPNEFLESVYGGFVARVVAVGDNGEIVAVGVSRAGFYFLDSGVIKDVVFKQFGENVTGSYYGAEERVIEITNPGSAYVTENEQAPNCTGPSPENIPLLMTSDAYLGTRYRGNYQSCEYRYMATAVAEQFFCGDALWAIEKGPCRQSFEFGTYFHNDYGMGSVSLSGNKGAALLWNADLLCNFADGGNPFFIPTYRDFHNGESCPPTQATITLDEDVIYHAGQAFQFYGTLSSGDYVLDGGGNCDSRYYEGTFPLADVPGSLVQIQVFRSRLAWCSGWDQTVALPYTFDGGFVYPTRLDGDGNRQEGQPAWVNDASVEEGDEDEEAKITYSISQSTNTMPAEGGTYTATVCCPEQDIELTVGPNTHNHPKAVWHTIQMWMGDSNTFYGLTPRDAARAIVTQEAANNGQ